MEVKIKKVHPDCKMPQFAHPGDVGIDLFSRDNYTLAPGERCVVYLGFAMEFPHGWAACMKDRSSVAKNQGIHVIGGAYDPGFRGEYSSTMINLSNETQIIEKGQKIVQLIFYKIDIPTIAEVDELEDSSRAEGRFGSTGKF